MFMLVRVICPSVLFALSALFLPQGGAQKTALVTVIADASGPIRDLAASDFVVREDNTKREVLSATGSDDPLSITLLVDTTQPAMGSQYPTQDVRNAIATFVKTIRAASPDAQIALMQYSGASVTTVDFSAPAGDLDKAVQRLYPNPQATAVLLEGLTDAGKKIAARPAPRRAIVVVDFNSPESSTEQQMKVAVDSVHNAGATVWPVSVRGTGPTVAIREEVLNKLTKANGGLRMSSVDSTGLEGLLKSVANSLASQYVVTFVRPNNSSPKATEFSTTRGAKVLLTPFMR
jgi:hypothetical protein